MVKPEIAVTCIFSDVGGDARGILPRSFYSYIQRELGTAGKRTAPPERKSEWRP